MHTVLDIEIAVGIFTGIKVRLMFQIAMKIGKIHTKIYCTSIMFIFHKVSILS